MKWGNCSKRLSTVFSLLYQLCFEWKLDTEQQLFIDFFKVFTKNFIDFGFFQRFFWITCAQCCHFFLYNKKIKFLDFKNSSVNF